MKLGRNFRRERKEKKKKNLDETKDDSVLVVISFVERTLCIERGEKRYKDLRSFEKLNNLY